MDIVFETERLIVRKYTDADEENFYRLNSDPEVVRYIREPKSREECRRFLNENITFYQQQPLMGRWALMQKQPELFIGSFAIIPVEKSADIQLGYALLKEYWGQGYATEITRAGLIYAKDVMKLDSIVGITEAPNIASQKVLLNCGFELDETKVEKGKEILCYVKRLVDN